jgi:hypothetical protein
MRFSRCLHSILRVATAVVLLGVALTPSAWARPKPKPGSGFRLFASAQTIFQVNRVQCRIFADGQLCATGSSTVGGGIWPKGTADQYIFAGGLQIGGVVDPTQSKTENGFAGDTAGAFFYNTSGSSNGLALRQILAATDAADVASWPSEARVPCSDPATTQIPGGIPAEVIARCTSAGVGTSVTGELFDPALQGTVSASQGDHWFVYWEGDPSNLASRTHPLGILVETRALAWNFPTGNEDIMYFIYTFYNITSARDDDYLSVRSSLRPFIQQKGKDFQALNTAKYGISLPEAGYNIKDITVDVVNDMDVANANANYASVNVPFALGYTYENDFSAEAARSLGWTFDPAIFGSAPFFAGVGFAGVKYLSSPINPVTQQQVGLTLFGTFSNSVGSLTDPNDDKQLYRYMTGHLLPTDGACTLNADVDKICSVNLDSPTDMRFYQSSGPFDLAPGQFGTIAVAYVFAPPVADGNCPGSSCDVKAADGGQADRLRIMGNAARMSSGVNQIDRMTGYLSFNDADADGKVTQNEIKVRPGSLLSKAVVAQSVFDKRFLLPFAPEAPAFFLVPGNNQVTVLWSPSKTETVPDPFFNVASSPTTVNPDGSTSANALYNPNFRGLDVEGYRVYRGRTSNPSQLTMLAQFDYAPDPVTGKGIFRDFLGTVKSGDGGQDVNCAPELAITLTCPIAFSTPLPGIAYTDSVEIDLVGTVTQVPSGGRVKLADNTAQLLPAKLDTAFLDIARGRLGQGVSTELKNNLVPFLFVDNGARNSVRYFYSVTAFDVNSVNSGPSSLESARNTKAVTPTPLATNIATEATTSFTVLGRNGPITTAQPSIDAATGKFSGPFPPSDGAELGLVSAVPEILSPTTNMTVRLDSIILGESGNTAAFGASPSPAANTYWYTAAPDTPDASTVSVPVTIEAGGSGVTEPASGHGLVANVAQVSAEGAAKYGGGSNPFSLSAQVTMNIPPSSYLTGQGLGCQFADPSFDASGNCVYNGGRWFDGPSPTANETMDNPNGGNMLNDLGSPSTADFNNAGQLTGVTTINEPHAYTMLDRSWRNMEWAYAGAARAADFNVYWGAGGLIDSVIDVTHDVVVPFDSTVSGTWGVLNTAATGGDGEFDTRNTVLTHTDMSCVEPLKTGLAGPSLRYPCDAAAASPAYKLSQTAQLGAVSFASGLAGNLAASPVAAQGGFLLYLAGHQFLFSMAALPADGAVWALRTYTGAVNGGNGASGDLGPYSFTPAIRPFTAIGARLQATVSAAVNVAASKKGDLSQVHTVPDPYYVRSAFESSTDQKVLKFVNLPQDAIIRIYSASGVLVRILEHHASNYSATSLSQGNETQWDLRNRNNQVVASGVYFYHIEAGDARRVGRFTVVNFAQ